MNDYFAEIMTGAMVVGLVAVCAVDVFASAYKERKEAKGVEQRQRAAWEREQKAIAQHNARMAKERADREARIYREQRKVQPRDGEELTLWPETKVMRTDSTLIAWN